MKLMYQWLGAKIVLVHFGHGLLGAGVVGILALSVPWWVLMIMAPLIAFSLWGWLNGAELIMPVAKLYLSGDPFPPGKATTVTATNRPRGE